MRSTSSRLYDQFRRRLVAMRKSAGLTQRQLAARLGRVPSFVAKVELGERRLDVVEFYWLCQACGAEPEALAAEVIEGLAGDDAVRARAAGRPARTPRARSGRGCGPTRAGTG